MKHFSRRIYGGLFALAISLACVGPQLLKAQETSADDRHEQQKKENAQNFGLREATPEEKQAEVNEVTVEVAHSDKTSEQLLRIVTTRGAVWDQTVGTPVPPPKPGAAVTIRRTILGGTMCKLNKWTTYRCIRVDKPVSSATDVAAVTRATSTQNAPASVPQVQAPAANVARPSLPSAAADDMSARQVEEPSPKASPLAQTASAAPRVAPNASPNVQSASSSPAKMAPQQPTANKPTNNVAPMDIAKAEFPTSPSAPPPSASKVQQSALAVSAPNATPRQDDQISNMEERRKQNEQNFGLREKTPEQKKVEVDEVNVEVARTEQTSEQLLRIVTTTGAIWDQTVGLPVKPPKPGTVITIKRAALGSVMCKIGKWTTYRCLRVDRSN